MSACPVCRNALTWVPQYQQWYCYPCQQYRQPPAPGGAGPQQQVYAQPYAPAAQAAGGGLWSQNSYRIRKKVLAIAQQYWIEDPHGRTLAYSKQKMFRFKEDIRIYTDERMGTELFRIKQTNWTDMWGNFAVVDSTTNATLGFLRRKAVMSAIRDQWEIFDANQQLVGGIYQSGGSAVLHRLVPGGKLAPEDMTITMNGQPVARIDQQFKVIGDIWDLHCMAVPPHFDRRVLIACALLMGLMERDRK